MDPRSEKIDHAALANDGREVQETLATPGWKVIEREFEAYVEIHLRGMLGVKSENDKLVQYQLGRIAAVKQDVPGIVKQIVDRGQKAARVRAQEETND